MNHVTTPGEYSINTIQRGYILLIFSRSMNYIKIAAMVMRKKLGISFCAACFSVDINSLVFSPFRLVTPGRRPSPRSSQRVSFLDV